MLQNHWPFCLSVMSMYCGQTVGWIKMLLGTEVGFSLGDIVLDGDPAPPPMERAQHPHFSVHVCCGQMVAHLSSCWTVVSNVVVKKQAWIKQFLWHNLPEECMHICGLVSALVRFISSTVLCFANKITSRKATGSVVIFCYLYCWKVLKFVIWYVNPVWVIADDFR